MEEKFNIDRNPEMSDARFEAWVKHEERKRSQVFAVVTFLGFVAIVAATVIVVAWSPWNG